MKTGMLQKSRAEKWLGLGKRAGRTGNLKLVWMPPILLFGREHSLNGLMASSSSLSIYTCFVCLVYRLEYGGPTEFKLLVHVSAVQRLFWAIFNSICPSLGHRTCLAQHG